MSALTIAWSMCAAACLMLALTHLLLWFRAHRSTVYLVSAVMALGAAVNAATELYMLETLDAVAYAAALKLQNVAVFVLLTGLVWYVYLHFGTARLWLATLITAMWVLALAINFASPYSLVFSEITELRRVTAPWGEQFSTAIGPANLWKLLAETASLLILGYLVDASLRAWRNGDRHRALVVGGSSVLFIVLAGIHAPLVDAGLVKTPYLISFAFLAIVGAMTYELVDGAVLAGKYAHQIQASERRWRTLLENVPLLVAGVDRAGRINYANPHFLRVSGYAPDQLFGRDLIELLPPPERSSAARGFSQAMRGKLPSNAEARLLTKQGDERQIAWSNVLLTDEDDQPTGTLSIGADVTDERNAQRDLRRTQREMERLMRASALGELASALAHELNQPLTATLSNAQAARRMLASAAPDLEEVAAILDDIVSEDKRAGEVIHRMRSMLSTGRVAQEQFTIDAAIRDVLALAHGEIAAAGVQLDVALQPGLPPIRAGRVEIQQVVMNLLLNALRAAKLERASQGNIEISARSDSGAVLIEVSDNGPGIPDERLPKVFEPYFTTSGAGMGMGLAISRRIVQAHGGKIWAKNRAGGGACFAFTIPIAPRNG